MKSGQTRYLASLVICSNRLEEVQKQIRHLVDYLGQHPRWAVDLLFVDNTPTGEIAHFLNDTFSSHCRAVHERLEGLSFARNRGWKEAKADWIGYIDDDMELHPDFLEQVALMIEDFDLVCFGGRYISCYEKDLPSWFPTDFEQNSVHGDAGIARSLPEIWGGCMFFKVDVLQKFSGFVPSLGMKGSQIAYGEDTLMIHKVWNHFPNQVGINPQLVVYHLIGDRKISIPWLLGKSYAQGRDTTRIKMIVEESVPSLSNAFAYGFYDTCRHFLHQSRLFMTSKDFKFSKLMVEILRRAAYHLGVFASTFNRGKTQGN